MAFAGTSDDAWQAARSLFSTGRYDDAIAAFQRMRADFPDRSADAYRMVGICQQWKGDYAGAIATYTNTLAEYPGSEAAAECHYWIGLCEEARGRSAQALEAFEKQAVDYPLNPRTQSALLKAGERLQATGRWTDAWARFEQVEKTGSGHALRARLLMGIWKQAKERYPEAIALFNQCAEQAADFSQKKEALLRVEECLRAQRKFAEDIEYLQQLQARYPELKDETALRQSEIFHEWIQEPERAASQLQDLINRNPDGPFTIEAKARLAFVTLTGLHDADRAKAMLDAFIEDYPAYKDMIVVLYQRGNAEYNYGKYAECLPFYLQAMPYADPGNYRAAILFKIADSYKYLGDSIKAKEYADKLIADYPTDDWARLAMDRYVSLTGQQYVEAAK